MMASLPGGPPCHRRIPVCIRCETIREDSEVPSVEAVEIEANHVMDGGLVEHLPDGTKIVRREVLHFHVFILNKGLFEGFAIRIARRYTILCTMHLRRIVRVDGLA